MTVVAFCIACKLCLKKLFKIILLLFVATGYPYVAICSEKNGVKKKFMGQKLPAGLKNCVGTGDGTQSILRACPIGVAWGKIWPCMQLTLNNFGGGAF